MKRLMADPDAFYKPKLRPSGHDIGRAFGRDNGGAIPSNLLQIPNSESNGQYLRGCKSARVAEHPARLPAKLPEFFIRFLTDPGNLVVDIFAGSNTTGEVAQAEGRRWMASEERIEYPAAAAFTFLAGNSTPEEMSDVYHRIKAGDSVDLTQHAELSSRLRPTYYKPVQRCLARGATFWIRRAASRLLSTQAQSC